MYQIAPNYSRTKTRQLSKKFFNEPFHTIQLKNLKEERDKAQNSMENKIIFTVC